MHTRKVLITSAVVSFIIFFIVYAGVEFRGLYLGPEVNLSSPDNGITVENPIIKTEGISERTKELTINGNQTLIDTTGHFSVNLVLSPGYNIITIVATDARGRHHSIKRDIYYRNTVLEESIKESIEESASSSVATTSKTN